MHDSDFTEQEIAEAISLGREAEDFLKSRLAENIMAAAQQKVDNALNELAHVDPHDSKKIIELQTVVKQFEHFATSLQDIVAAGDCAYQLYSMRNEESE